MARLIYWGGVKMGELTDDGLVVNASPVLVELQTAWTDGIAKYSAVGDAEDTIDTIDDGHVEDATVDSITELLELYGFTVEDS